MPNANDQKVGDVLFDCDRCGEPIKVESIDEQGVPVGDYFVVHTTQAIICRTCAIIVASCGVLEG